MVEQERPIHTQAHCLMCRRDMNDVNGTEEQTDCNFTDEVESEPVCVKQIRKFTNGV